MREEKLLRVINQQDEINENLIKNNFRQMLENEFVLGNVFTRYLDYMERRAQSVTEEQNTDLNELIKKSTPPVKKLRDFDISKHSSPMYLHKHTYIEADYVYKGSCTYYINNDEQVFQLKEKEICIVNQNIAHGIEKNCEEDIIIKCMIPFEYINLEHYNEIGKEASLKKFFDHALKEDLTKASYLVYSVHESEYVEELIYHMFCEFIEKGNGWRQVIKNNLSSLFIYLMRAEENQRCIMREIEEENLNITKVLDCIRKNYQYITLKDIAKDLHFHENYLSRMIKQNYQKSFRDLLSQIRLAEAEKLLINTDLSVTEIAAKVGYHKPNFFYKLFKDHYGVTPIEFRTSNQL